MTLPLRISDVPYFDNAYRGDLIVTQGVLYYLPWVNVALEQKQQVDTGQMDRLFPLSIVIELVIAGVKALNGSTRKPKPQPENYRSIPKDFHVKCILIDKVE